MKRIYLDPALVPPQLRGGYSGKHFEAILAETMTVPATAGLWDGGSRDVYRALELKSGRTVPLSDQSSAPFDGGRADREVTLQQGIVVVRHTISRGKDLGLTFWLRPDDAVPLLPAPVALTAHERVVLLATRSFKSHHMGRDRFAMASEEIANEERVPANMRRFLPERIPGERQITRAEWEVAKSALIDKGLLNKAGAITVAGRNALEGA